MSEYESITQELREYISNLIMSNQTEDGLLSRCDNIDAIHRSLEAENERMRKAQDDWIKLPIDANGVPIHIGDWIVNPDISNQKQKVAAIAPDSVYWWGEDGCHWRRSHHVRHYHPDTWESIISDAVKLGFTEPDNEHLADKLVSRCKALCEHTREGEE